MPETQTAPRTGADSIGVVRIEFLFLDRNTAPDVEEQQAVYGAIAGAMTGRRVTLRTLDVGGDKPLSYLPMAFDANPFLRQGGIRLSLPCRSRAVKLGAAVLWEPLERVGAAVTRPG